MFNVTVLKLKDIKKYFISTIIFILLIICLTKVFSQIKKNNEKLKQEVEHKVDNIASQSFKECLDRTMPVIASVNEEYNTIAKEDDINQEKKNILQEILKNQISSIKGVEMSENEQTEIIEQEIAESNGQEEKSTEDNNQNQMAQTGLKTEIVTNNPIAESFNVQYGSVKIKNQTSYNLTQEMLTPDVTIENKRVMLFHTHSCESYTSSDAYPYTPTGTFRTTDLNYTVTRVGEELANRLKEYNYEVVHDTSYHDYPAYNGSYTRSLATVENLLKTYPTDIIMDVHRDAIGSRSDYAPAVKIGDTDVAAQIMFVIGTNDGGLWHPNWNQNLKFAIKIQEKAEELYPGLFKPIMLTDSRYNQHTGKYASIIEVGATGNTLEQCLTSMKYLAKVMSEVMK